MTKIQIATIDDLREYGHYMTKLILAEAPQIVTVRLFCAGEETYGTEGERHILRNAGPCTMIKLPNGIYGEIYPHELETLEERHTLVWEKEVDDDSGRGVQK